MKRIGTITRRGVLFGGAAVGGFALGGAVTERLPTLEGAPQVAQTPPDPTILNDASGLSATRVHIHTRSSAQGDALVDVFRAELAAAKSEGRPVNVGAARHSMGGHAIPPNGRAITVDNAAIDIDTSARLYRVNGGARWADVIAALDPMGFSPAVMQSNHDFGVAATFSVNAHGWPVPFGPMGATVRSIRMVLPDGDLVTASRSENADLFALTMGGYGLIGLIVDLDIEMVTNMRLRRHVDVLPAHAFAAAFANTVRDRANAMVYGRLNVDRSQLFEEALLVRYTPSADQSNLSPAVGSGFSAHLASRIYRGQVGREAMKRGRWWIESRLQPALDGESTRNSLMNEPVATLDDRDPSRVDILHEYFVPFDAFSSFLTACRDVIPDAFVEFLNVTLRFVDADPVSVLAHSPTPRIAAVMSFSQETTARAEADHQRMTRALIDRVVGLGGTYYLPYRPHATVPQLIAAYPKAPAFAARKRELDRQLTLRNTFWDRYLDKI